MKLRILLLIAFVVFIIYPSPSAEYNGEDIDGVDYSATAYSYSTGKYYYVTVTFDGDKATITFRSGNAIILTLDDEEIDDPHSVDAFDYRRGVYWELDVDGLD